MSQRKPNDLDLWSCEDCTETFAILGQFGTPNFCPNCGSEDVKQSEIPNRPDRPYPFDPNRFPPIWFGYDDEDDLGFDDGRFRL